MTKEVKREVIDGLNTAQLTALCSHYSVDYSDRGGKKNNKAKCAALWTNLPKASDDTRAIRDDVWAVLQTLKSDDKVATFKERLGEERRQRAAQTHQSPQAAGQSTEKTVAEIEMDEGQATPEKQHDERRKRSKENTPQFKAALPPQEAIRQENLDLRHAVSASLQFSASESVDDDWAAVVHHLGPALQQFKTILQRVLGAVEADRRAQRHTACAELESDISHASLLADAVAAAATVGKMSAVAEQTSKREKALRALSEKVTTDIAATVQRSVKEAAEKQEKQPKEAVGRQRTWRDVVASDRPPLPRFLWVQERTVFLTPKNTELRKQNIDKNTFGRELDAALHQMAGPRAQPEQCMIESMVRTGVGLFKVQLAGCVVGAAMAAKGITVGKFGD